MAPTPIIIPNTQAACKDYSESKDLCLNMPNGMRLPNPLDCRTSGFATSFMYCLNEVAIPTSCPPESTWSTQLLSCITATGSPNNVVPSIPRVRDLPLLPVFRPENMPRRPRQRPTRPTITNTKDITTFVFFVKSLDGEILDITEADIINAIFNGTGAAVTAVDRINYLIDMELGLNEFNKPLTPSTLQNIETGLQGFFINSFADVDPRAIRVRGVQGGVSTASITEPSQSLTADVRIQPNDEPQTAMDIAAALPTFDLLVSQTLRNIENNTAELLGVPDDIAEYFQQQLMRLNSWEMVSNVSVLHRLGKAGQDLLKSAVLSGDMSKSLSKELGYDVEAVMQLDPLAVVVEAPAPAPTLVIEPVTPNAAFSSGVNGLLMAVAGVAAVLCML